MSTVTMHRRHRRRANPAKLNAATALLVGRATWRMYRGRGPWQAARRRHR